MAPRIAWILGALIGACLTPSAPALTESNREQVEEMIQGALREHHRAASYQDWATNDYNPESLAEKIRARLDDRQFVAALCQTLRRLPVRDLYHVSETLEQDAHTHACLTHLAARYQTYLSTTQTVLRSRYLELMSGRSQKLGPSQEIVLDAKSMPVVIDGGVPEKTLVLTFDDGPHATRTPQLLRLLEQESAQVMFFVVGRNTTLFPDVVRAASQAGHEIGNHSFTHPDLRKLKHEAAVAEIEDGFDAITRALGEARVFFRFPYGANTQALRNHLIKTATPEFFWNIDTMDWKHKDPEFLIDYALKQVRGPGRGVVLFHDIQPQTLAIMPAFLAALKSEGYRLAVFRPSRPRTRP